MGKGGSGGCAPKAKGFTPSTPEITLNLIAPRYLAVGNSILAI